MNFFEKNRQYIFILLFLLFDSCQETSNEFDSVLKNAGNNKENLQNTISFYKHSKDSLKVKAAYFLISNMLNHYNSKTSLLDKNGAEIIFNPYEFKNRDSARVSLDSIFQKTYSQHNVFFDFEILQDKYLIENIELSFKEWQTNPWSKNINFLNFCEYILPYRASNEPISNWRIFFSEKYKQVKDSLINRNCKLIDVCLIINEDLKKSLKYDTRCFVQINNQSVFDVLQNKMGNCDDLTMLTTCAMRSVGLPVTIDYVPYWAHMQSGHSWNALVDENGRTIHFGGAEKSPGEHRIGKDYLPHYRISKVYRRTFSSQKNTLAFISNNKDIPDIFRRTNYIDVTKDYVAITDVKMRLKNVPPSNQLSLYMCV